MPGLRPCGKGLAYGRRLRMAETIPLLQPRSSGLCYWGPGCRPVTLESLGLGPRISILLSPLENSIGQPRLRIAALLILRKIFLDSVK